MIMYNLLDNYLKSFQLKKIWIITANERSYVLQWNVDEIFFQDGIFAKARMRHKHDFKVIACSSI